jgi:hypothetical protein
MANLTFRHGDVAKYTITLVRSDASPLDLTGTTVWLTIKPTYGGSTDDSDAILKFYWVDGGASYGLTVSIPTSGVVNLKILHADTVPLPIGVQWVYDIQVLVPEDDGDNLYTWDEGTVQLIADVTQRITTP